MASDLTITDLSYSNGSIISNSFSGSGTSYTLSFSTNVAGGEASIYLPSDNTVLDGAGNKFGIKPVSWTYSNTRPRFTNYMILIFHLVHMQIMSIKLVHLLIHKLNLQKKT